MSDSSFQPGGKRPPIIEKIPGRHPICFISDLHLGDGSPTDIFFGKDQHLLALLNRILKEGTLLVILGDAIDLHQAWSITRILRAHQSVFAKLSELSRKGQLYYVIGNHDYDISLFRDILNFRVCDELIIGDKILAIHGWQYDPYLSETINSGSTLPTTIHHLIERTLNTWIRIPLGEFYTLANRIFFWVVHKAALGVLLYERIGRWAGLSLEAKTMHRYLNYWAHGNMGDPMGVFRPAIASLKESNWDAIICGHSHLPGVLPIQNKHYINTGSWTFGSAQFVIWDGTQFSCRDWISGRTYKTELYTRLLDGSIYHKNFWQWWRENYMGFLRYREGEEKRGRLRNWEQYLRDHQYVSLLPSTEGQKNPKKRRRSSSKTHRQTTDEDTI